MVLSPDALDMVELDNLLYVVSRAAERLNEQVESPGDTAPWLLHLYRNQYIDMEKQRRALKAYVDKRKKQEKK
jgi:hypothetical protein